MSGTSQLGVSPKSYVDKLLVVTVYIKIRLPVLKLILLQLYPSFINFNIFIFFKYKLYFLSK